MIRRLLPAEEWSRLAGTELGSVLPLCSPDTTTVIVVEDAGTIIGTWAAITVVHAEGVWIHPDHRGKTSVARLLWTGMCRALRGRVSAVITGAANDAIRSLIIRHGGARVPDLYRLPLR